jgi:acylglycerol lipase
MENITNSNYSLNVNEQGKSCFDSIKKILKDPDNVLGTIEVDNFVIHRKYVTNFYDTFVRLYYTSVKFNPKINSPVAKLCLVHGFGHHSGDFIELALYLAQNGIHCFMLDLSGHGYSGGMKFDWSIEDFHRDIISLIKETEKESFELPLFILGHSLGGGLVSSLFINNPYLQIQGVILSAPLIGCPIQIPEDSVKSYLIRNYGYKLKDLLVSGNINPTMLTKVDSEIPSMINDTRNVPICTPNSYRNIMKMYSRIIENCRNFSLPCLIMHGDADKITNIQHSKIFHDNIRR